MKTFSKSMVRITAFLIALVMVVIAAGCGKPKPGDEQSNGTSEESTNTSAVQGDNSELGSTGESGQESTAVSASEGSNAGNSSGKSSGTNSTNQGKSTVNKTGFPIVSGEKMQLSIMLPRQTGSPQDFETLAFTKEYEKMTNIDIKYIVVNEGEQFTKKQAAISSGNLPDIFALYSPVFSSAEVYKYSKEGVFVEIGSKLAEWGPNINNMLNQVPDARKSSTLSGGKLYSIPKLSQEGWWQTWTINKKWLDELGLEIPTTIDEFYNVLKMFKTGDPNGNNQADEQAFAMWEWNPNIWNPWGLNLGWYEKMTVDEKGKVAYGPLTNNFREGIRFWQKCYNEGLIYKRALGTNYTEFQALLGEGKVGCFVWPWPWGAISESKLNDYVPLAFPKGKNTGNFKPGVSSYSSGVQPHSYLITKKCKSVEAAIRFIDYFYTPEGHMLKTYGPAGKFYSIIGGKFKTLTTKDSYLKYGLGDIIGSNARIPETRVIKRHTSEMSTVEKYIQKYTDQMKTAFAPGNPKYSISSLMLNETESKRADEIMKVVSPAYGWGILAIMGSKNVETEWNTFVKEYEDKGAKELVTIYQNAFNRK